MASIKTAIRSVVQKGIETIAEFNRKRLPALDRAHPYLTGIYEPMQRELAIEELTVAGTIPPELDGRYLRIGPNPIAPDPKSYHWFIGDGMVHGIRIKEGRARWYRNRWIRSEAVGGMLQVPAAPGPRHGTFDTVNTNVIGHAGATWALVEAGSTPVRLNDTLEQQTYDDFGGTLKGAFTAHPHRDPATGELHAICYDATVTDEIRHVVVSAEGRVVRELAIPVRHGPSIHDCAITDRFVIILDLPVTFSMAALIGGRGFPYRWNASHEARIGLLPRNGGADDILWIRIDPCYIFHTGNAFELADGRVVMDAVVYNRMFAESTQGPDANPRGLERWTIDNARGSVERGVLDPAPQEFPRIDERRTGKPHRFLYSLGLPKIADEHWAGATFILKHDLNTGTRQLHDFGAGRFPGEFVFVPRHADAAEDEGWVIGLVVDMQRGETDLAILDAQAIEAEPVATTTIPHRVPAGFHGNWVADRTDR
jgi:8'-apo-carotenoid 13,14-cleaving dioxygenase